MCKLCNYYPCHPQCPNYELPKAEKYCSICGDGIYFGDKYLQNDDNEYAHVDCFDCNEELVRWLGYTIETMD